MGSIRLVGYFSAFRPFSAFVRIFGGEYLSSASRKAHGCILPIFIFVSAKFEAILSSRAIRKPLMSTRKKYVYSCHMGFGLECSLGGEWSATLGGKLGHWLRGRSVWLGASPTHSMFCNEFS